MTPSVRVDSEFAYSSIIAAEQTAACGKDHIIGSKPRHRPGLFRVLRYCVESAFSISDMENSKINDDDNILSSRIEDRFVHKAVVNPFSTWISTRKRTPGLLPFD